MNLLKAGHSLAVYDINPKPVDELVKAGAQRGKSARDVAEFGDVTIMMLPDSRDVEEAMLGENGVLQGAKPGSTVIDMSSIAPLVSEKLAAEAEKRGVEMLDAPVSGGEAGAIQGSLSIMAGGKKSVFDKCLDILKVMGRSIVRVGDSGAGQMTKLVNQIIVAVNIAAVSEAFVLGVKGGLDPKVVYQAIRGGLAGSNVLDSKAPMIYERNFKPGFRIKLHWKDLKNAIETARDLDVPLLLTCTVQQMLTTLINDGKGDLDHSALVNFAESLAKVEVRR